MCNLMDENFNFQVKKKKILFPCASNHLRVFVVVLIVDNLRRSLTADATVSADFLS